MGWRKSDSIRIKSQIAKVLVYPDTNIPKPSQFKGCRTSCTLGEFGMEQFILSDLLGSMTDQKDSVEPDASKAFYFGSAVEAGLLEIKDGKYFFPDKALVYLANRVGIR